MILPDPQSNEPLAPSQIDCLRARISNRQQALNKMNDSIKEEKKNSGIYGAAIAHLEPCILRAQHALTTQRDLATRLLEMKLDLELAGEIPGPNWAEESKAKDICVTTMARVADQVEHEREMFARHIESLQENISVLQTSIQHMETELYGDRLMQAESLAHLADLRKLRDAIGENIKLLKSRLNHVKRTPTEIWAKIFGIRMRADITEFLESPEPKQVPVSSLNISHVCRLWRGVAITTRSLWHFVPIYANSAWPRARLEYLTHSRSIINKPPTLVCNLARGHRGGGMLIGVDETSIFDAYSLHIIAQGHNNNTMMGHSTSNRSSSIPFRLPKMLTVRFLSPPNHNVLNSLLHPFSECTGIELVVRDEYRSISLDLSTSHPRLTYLKLDMAIFQPFSLTGYLGPTLQELHITHCGTSSIPRLATVLRLPMLRVLGVTPPDMEFTQSLDLPALWKVIIYAPKLLDLPSPSLAQLVDHPDFSRAQELELQNWPLFQAFPLSEWSIITPVTQVVNKICSIASLRCIRTVITGSELLELVTALKKSSNAASKLDNIVIDCCTGITRGQCDAVGQLVGKVEVYV